MPRADWTLDELRSYRPEPDPPLDLEQFWSETLAEAASLPLSFELTAAGPSLRGVTCSRATFAGFRGAPISGWFVRPDSVEQVPGVVWYHGYTARGGRPLELYALAAQGVAVLSMDCRGQSGEAPEPPTEGTGHVPGWMTKGARDPHTYYYRDVYADAVRALETLCSLPEVDDTRVAVTGASQGGGLALAVAALSARPVFAWADIPFLCHFRRAVDVALAGPYLEISDFLRRRPELEEDVFATLGYFDNLNLAPSVSCPVVVTAGLWDDVCPPSTIFPTFERIGAADKELVTFSYLRHELFYDIDVARLTALVERLGVAA